MARLLVHTGVRIKTIRVARKMTQEEVSHRSGIGYKRYQVIEAGKANITLGTIGRIATALKICPSKLLK